MELKEFIERYQDKSKDYTFGTLFHNVIYGKDTDIYKWLLDQNTELAYCCLAFIDYQLGDDKNAIKYIEKAIKINPKYLLSYRLILTHFSDHRKDTNLILETGESYIEKVLESKRKADIELHNYCHRLLTIIYYRNKNYLKFAKNYVAYQTEFNYISNVWPKMGSEFAEGLHNADFTVDEALEIFNPNQKNFKLYHKLCDEIRQLREKVAELSYQPGGREYEEAKKRFQENV